MGRHIFCIGGNQESAKIAGVHIHKVKIITYIHGDRLTFWGGGVDTQHTLPSGTPKEVYDQVIERLKIFSPGGFVFATIHNVVANVPAENLKAMYQAVNDFRGL